MLGRDTSSSQMKSQFLYMGVSENRGTPKSSILIGFSIIFTIHFGGKHPYFLVQHPHDSSNYFFSDFAVASTGNLDLPLEAL